MATLDNTQTGVSIAICSAVLIYCIVNLGLFISAQIRAQKSLIKFQTFGVSFFIISLALRIAWVGLKHKSDGNMSDYATNRFSLLFNYNGLTMYVHFWLHIRLTISNSNNIKRNLIVAHTTFGIIDVFVNLYIIILVIVLGAIDYSLGRDDDPVYTTTLLVISVFEMYISIVFLISGAILISRTKKWAVLITNVKEEIRWFIASSVISSACSLMRGILLSWYYMSGSMAAEWTYPWLFYIVPDCLIALVLSIDMGRIKRWGKRRREQLIAGELEESSIAL